MHYLEPVILPRSHKGEWQHCHSGFNVCDGGNRDVGFCSFSELPVIWWPLISFVEDIKPSFFFHLSLKIGVWYLIILKSHITYTYTFEKCCIMIKLLSAAHIPSSFAYERLEDIAWTLLIAEFNSLLFPIMPHRNILLCFTTFSVRYLEI